MTTDKSGEPLYPRDAMIAAGEETAAWIVKVTELRAAIRDLMQHSWEGGLDDASLQDILIDHKLLVTVPSDWNTLLEFETGTMLGLAWDVCRTHELDLGNHCRWCHTFAPKDDGESCVPRLETKTYEEVLANGGQWDPELNEWHLPDEADSDG